MILQLYACHSQLNHMSHTWMLLDINNFITHGSNPINPAVAGSEPQTK